MVEGGGELEGRDEVPFTGEGVCVVHEQQALENTSWNHWEGSCPKVNDLKLGKVHMYHVS